MSNRTGQLFTTDFVISAFVFIILLNVAVFSWNLAYDRQDRFAQEDVMQRKAFHAASLMVRTPGYPADWTPSTVAVIGLADPDHVVQEAKMDELAAMDVSTLRATLDIIPSYIQVTLNTSTTTRQVGTAPVNASDLVVERRSILYNGTNGTERGTLEVILWQ